MKILLPCLVNIISSSERHLVDDLFNGSYTKEIYTGYLKTDIEGTELFYLFAPSQSSPKDDPIILWLNGGPGCSSITSFFDYAGPFKFLPRKKHLVKNEYPWNEKANMFFVDSPGGVGFSKLKDPKFFYNDEIQGYSLSIAIQNFFKIFSEYQNNTFFITGVSYAGTYIPHLVTKLFKYMDEHPEAIQLNLKGFLIANPYTYEETDWEDSMVEFGFSHGLISIETFVKYLKECPHWPQVEKILKTYEESDDYKFEPIVNKDKLMPERNVSKACNEARNETKNQLNGISFYGIYNQCPTSDVIFELKEGFTNVDYEESNLYDEQTVFKNMLRSNINQKYMKYTGKAFSNNNKDSGNENEYELAIDFFPSCKNDLYTIDFLNDNNTKAKLGVDLSIKYRKCFSEINYKWGDASHYYRNEIKEFSQKKNFTSWIFSGTEDIACTTLGNLRFLKELNYTIKDKWKKWVIDGQVVGMEQGYDYGLRFFTVKNCGHCAVKYQPKVAKDLLNRFIEYNRVDRVDPKHEENKDPKSEENNNNESFPVWAIVLISVAGVLIIAAVVFIILRVRRKNSNLDIKTEENGMLLSDVK